MSDVDVKIQEEGPVKRHLLVVVPPERVHDEFDKAYAKLRPRAQVKGFRKGKVPRHVLEQRFGDEVREDVVKHLIEETCREALTDRQLDVVSPPRLLRQDLSTEQALTYEALVDVRPEFTLADYKGVEAVRRIVRVEDRHVEAALQSARERAAVLQAEEDRVNVASGDVVVFDMYGFSEGEAIESASGQGIVLEVGSGRFPEDFEKQIIGVTRGITTPIDVRFPDDHGQRDLAGKLVRFQVTVREIKNKILPAVDDNLAAELGIDDCETLDELRGRIRKDLEARALADAERRMRNELLAHLVDAHGFEVPETLVDEQMANMLRDMGVQSIPHERVDEVRAALEPRAIRQVRAGFVLDAIAKAEALEVTSDELRAQIERQVRLAGERASEVRTYFSRPSSVAALETDMLRDKALDRVVELATQRDETVEESQVADQSQTG